MGEVYKARDTRLNRVVALKVSKSEFSERFEIEARAVAALNHSNICTVHDVGPNYLVMEYVVGTPLKGPLPLDRALKMAAQICAALDAAHKKGITHRDLKPANILVTKNGIKLLDFGLAKIAAPAKRDDATVTLALTGRNEILGTLQYMSPEQMQAQTKDGDIDARSDIFSFGAVLYEMITGKRAFEGASVASVIAAVMERPAPSIASVAPPALDRLLQRCLRKDPDDRWQSARDLKDELEWIAGSEAEAAPAVASTRGRWRDRAGWIAAMVLAVLFLAVVTLFLARSNRNESPAGDVMRLAINPPEGSAVSGMYVTVPAPQLAISPDGRAVVFVAAPDESHSILWLRLLNDTTARELPGTENATFPFWSPDSRWIGFVSQGKIRKIPVNGGAVQVLANAGTPRGMSWGPDDTILFANGNTGLLRVASTGGPVTEVTKPDLSRQEGSHRWPYFLPDGRHFLYVIRSGLADQQGVYVGSLDGKIKKRLFPGDTAAAYASPGYVLYLDGYALLAQAFETERFELSGQPFVLAEKVGHSSIGDSSMSVSSSGMLAYSGPTLRPGRLTWFDREGKPAGTVAQEGDYVDFRLSPDENRVAASLVNPKSADVNIWLSDISRGSTSRLTSGRLNLGAVWSPDGAKVAYRKAPKGTVEIYQISASGGGKDELLLGEELQRTVLPEYNSAEPTDWSSDGRHLLYSIATSNTQLWLFTFSAAGGVANPVRLVDSPTDVIQGNFSPDGRMIAYTANESGTWEVYAQTFPLSDRRWLVSINGGYEPRWSADGHEIYYLSKDRKLMAVPVVAGSSFGVPKPLFQTKISAGVSGLNMHYVPGRDGRRFLVNTQIGEPAPNPITIVLNWASALKK